MLRFKEYIKESSELSFIDFITDNYDIYETFDDISQIDEDYQPSAFGSVSKVADDIDKHMGNFEGSSDEEKAEAVGAAREHFKNKDFRTAKEKASGSIAKKARLIANGNMNAIKALETIRKEQKPLGGRVAGLKGQKIPKPVIEGNFENPLKVNISKSRNEPTITTKTAKHLSSGKKFKIPEGFPNAGMGATVSALRLTPGNANLGDNKMLKSCPKATEGCGGSGDVGKAGVGKDALCLATRGQDATVGSIKAKLSRTRAFFDKDSREHATNLLSDELSKAKKDAKADNSIHHFRPNDSSDMNLVAPAINKHHPEIVTYGYSKHLKHDDENTGEGGKPFNHISRSDTGPEYDANGIKDEGNSKEKNTTIEHLLGGKRTRAYMVLAQKRASGEDSKPVAGALGKIHTIRYHRYDATGKHIGHEDFDADRNIQNGDLRMYDKPAERNLESDDGRKKGAVTITDISGGKEKDITGISAEEAKKRAKNPEAIATEEHEAPNPMVHPIDDKHIQPDPNNEGKEIYHVDPPNGDWRNASGKLQQLKR